MPRLRKDTLDLFYDYDIWLENRTLYIGAESVHALTDDYGADEISPYSAERVIKGLEILESQVSDKPIKIILNSPGGDLAQGLAIYDRIRLCKSEVIIEAYGQCMSAASIILQAGDIRCVSPNCILMVHDGEDSVTGSPESVLKWAKLGKLQTELMYQIYSEKSGKSVSYWSNKCKNDYIMTAAKAVAEGLADKVID